MDYHALEEMTVIQLRDEAKKFPDVKGVAAMKKDELVTLVAERLGLEKTATKPKPKKVAGSKMDKKTIKKMMLELKEQRNSARSGKDKKKIVMFRKRIHALKRRLRKIA
ncbi:MAG: hypothetical protein OEN01_07805 [Candidatus Krumholzibacteria bacterium]|nr:hypothetical protein [Candidatus Krumholzibacteria bacterium]